MVLKYFPPTPEDLRALKTELGFTGEQMAQMFGLAGNNQWRKYTGGADPRPMALPMLFLALALQDRAATVEQVLEKCRKVGASIEITDE
ncbi:MULTISPECIES: hypothetical protein [Burkholderia]|jgi:predicted transcriptional regulator|uniref:hypothetical protein n=1 Tax=Burkholderia TaxID=32008 RepID=UPI000706C282|nr:MULTISPECIES: hypothetical protein [Burkholderia]ALK30841.1 hypothetical protein bpln_1g20530 [Burkholderia plantarii]GLZ19470.1 hypothetical protein Bpla01_30000 [Burkholderia plantarii]